MTIIAAVLMSHAFGHLVVFVHCASVEPRWCPPDLGATLGDVREDYRVLRVPGHPEQPDS